MILGMLMGLLTNILQLFYPYYLFAQNRRQAGYSWPSVILQTLTLGHIFAAVNFVFSGFGIMSGLGNMLWGMKVGWAKGISGAIALPRTFHTKFQERLPLNPLLSTTLNGWSVKPTLWNLLVNIGRLCVTGIFSAFNTDRHGELALSHDERRALGVRIENQIRSLLYLIEQRQQAIVLNPDLVAWNSLLLNNINNDFQRCYSALRHYRSCIDNTLVQLLDERFALHLQAFGEQSGLNGPAASAARAERRANNEQLFQEMKKIPYSKETPLSHQEIVLYRQWISESEISNQEKRLKETALKEYEERVKCPITNDTVDHPMTVVIPPSGKSTSSFNQVYDHDGLMGWVKVGKDKTEYTKDPISRHELKDLAIYSGFPKSTRDFILQVRKIIALSSQASDKADVGSPKLAASDDKTSRVSPLSTNGSQALARMSRRPWLDGRFPEHKPSKPDGGVSTPAPQSSVTLKRR